MLRQKAFTLAEIMIVIVIIGIMATFAIPKMGNVKEKAIFSEAVTALKALHNGQEMFYLENGVYSNDCTKLDGAVTLSTKNWASLTCKDTGEVVATRTSEAYKITISPQGFYGGSFDPSNAYLMSLCPNGCVLPV